MDSCVLLHLMFTLNTAGDPHVYLIHFFECLDRLANYDVCMRVNKINFVHFLHSVCVPYTIVITSRTALSFFIIIFTLIFTFSFTAFNFKEIIEVLIYQFL